MTLEFTEPTMDSYLAMLRSLGPINNCLHFFQWNLGHYTSPPARFVRVLRASFSSFPRRSRRCRNCPSRSATRLSVSRRFFSCKLTQKADHEKSTNLGHVSPTTAGHTHTSLIKFDHTSQQISTKLSVQLHHRSSVFKRSCNSAMTCGEIMLPRQALDLLGSAVLGSWPRLHPQRRDRMSDVEIVPGGCTRHHQASPNSTKPRSNCH